MHDSSKNYTDILLERLFDQNKLILEAVSGIKDLPTRDEFDGMKADIKVIKAAVTDQSKELADHERRIIRLESRAA